MHIDNRFNYVNCFHVMCPAANVYCMSNAFCHFVNKVLLLLSTPQLTLASTAAAALFHQSYLSFFVRRLSVQATVLKLPPQAVVLKDVQHSCHLTENQHS